MSVTGQFLVSSLLLLVYLWWRGGKKKTLIKGHFEMHHTVEIGLEEDFLYLCRDLELKPILIELPVGAANPKQWMTSAWYVGDEAGALCRLRQLTSEIRCRGFRVVREKLEAGASCAGVPEDTPPSPDHPDRYFEFHVKIFLKPDLVEALQEITGKHEAHLSKSSLRGEPTRRFLTLRLYMMGRLEAFGRLDSLVKDLKEAGLDFAAVEREFCVFDSNVEVDRGWID